VFAKAFVDVADFDQRHETQLPPARMRR
jgi:hypothetical protein